MTGDSRSEAGGIDRRTYLRGLTGSAALLGALGTLSRPGLSQAVQTDRTFAIEQVEACRAVEPLSYEGLTVEEFYDYGGDSPFSANTPTDLEESDASLLFLYLGPEGLSLVAIHDDTEEEGGGGGAVSLAFEGLPEDGEWVVRDDPSMASAELWPANETDGGSREEEPEVHWAFHPDFTDGGAYRGGLDGEFELEVTPSFNGAATLEPLTPGEITSWQFLSGDPDSPTRIELSMEEPLTVRTGSCE